MPMALMIGALISTSAYAQDNPVGSDAVLATVQRFMAAATARDSVGMAAALHPNARFTLLRPAPGGGDSVRVAVLTGEQFMRAVSNPNQPPLDEPIRNARVTIDANLATIWAEYQVRANGRVTHCGYDAFQLVKTATGWRILSIADTYRQTGCGPMWP
jgi:hypothetical protein